MIVNHCGADHIVDVTDMVGVVSGTREERMSLPDQIARYMSLREPQTGPEAGTPLFAAYQARVGKKMRD